MHWRRKWQPTPVFLPGESQGQGSLVAAVSGVAQSQTRLKQLSSSDSDHKESACNTGDPGSIPGLGGSPEEWILSILHFHSSLSCIGEGNVNPLQYSCLENSMDRGAWRGRVHEVAESDMTEQLTYTVY